MADAEALGLVPVRRPHHPAVGSQRPAHGTDKMLADTVGAVPPASAVRLARTCATGLSTANTMSPLAWLALVHCASPNQFCPSSVPSSAITAVVGGAVPPRITCSAWLR